MTRLNRVSLAGAAAASAILAAFGAQAQAARDFISIVGSSTVYPFSTVVAEQFGRTSRFKTPKVESTGSGGGIKLFCAGVGVQHPDIANSSRAIKDTELANCAANGVREVIELKLGFDGIVIAESVQGQGLELSLRDVFLALAKEVPDPAGGEKLVANPYRTWRDVNRALPEVTIEVLGPPPTSGTRDAFVELGMEGGCAAFPWIKALKATDENRFKQVCHTIREDGRFVEAGENDNLIVQKLRSNPRAVGIFGFSFLEQNMDTIQGATINGVAPTFESIADGEYPISRPMYVYVKKAHVAAIPGMQEFLNELTSKRAMGEDGYLADRGLVPLPPAQYQQVVQRVQNLEAMPL